MTQQNQELLCRIGENMLRCMAIQACIRTQGTASVQQQNELAMAMTIATRAAGRMLRINKEDPEIYELLPGTASEVLSIVDYIADGSLALGFANWPAETV